MFEGKECLISDSSDQELFGIPMQDKCFSFNPLKVKEVALQSQVDTAKLWHKRLGHFHSKCLVFMQKNEMVVDFQS